MPSGIYVLSQEGAMMDWDHIRRVRFTKDATPLNWPEDVRGISNQGLSLLGVHEKTGKLYWDGKEIVTRSVFKLDTLERWLAFITLGCVVLNFLINAANFLNEIYEWW
jgi:hypothetical protein